MTEYIETITKMIEGHYNATKYFTEAHNCSLEECFPYFSSEKIEINGKIYKVRINIDLEEVPIVF